jgi:scyllo-inositol 2-dehydrogenase (NADP+)
MNTPIKTALLAYGMSGKVFHAPFFSTHSGFDLYAVLERNQKTAIDDYPNSNQFSTIDDLLKDKNIELVVINTPNNTHFDYAKLALLADKHILIEKPAAPTVAEFEEILALAKAKNKKVFVYQNRRYSSDFMALKNVINSKKLGQIIELHLRFDRYKPEIGLKSFKENPVPASGIWYDLGAHLVDQAISIFGKPKSFSGKKLKFRENTKVDDYATATVQFQNDVTVFITTSLHVLNPLPGIVIHGTKGSFIKSFCDEQEAQLLTGMRPDAVGFGKEKPNNEGVLTYINDKNEKITELIPSLNGNFMALFEDLYQSIRCEKEFAIKNEEILQQISLLCQLES